MSTVESTSRRTSPITVMIVDDSAAVREALAEVLDADGRFRVVGTANDPTDVEGPAALLPELAVVDVQMPHGGGPEAARRIIAASPDTVVVALSAMSTPSLRRQMADAGAVAYLTKGDAGDVLLDRLVVACRGEGG